MLRVSSLSTTSHPNITSQQYHSFVRPGISYVRLDVFRAWGISLTDAQRIALRALITRRPSAFMRDFKILSQLAGLTSGSLGSLPPACKGAKLTSEPPERRGRASSDLTS